MSSRSDLESCIIDQARIGFALDIVDIGLVHGPGIDGAFDLFNGAVIETEGFGFQIGGTGFNPGLARRFQRVLGRRGQESIDGLAQESWHHRRLSCSWLATRSM